MPTAETKHICDYCKRRYMVLRDAEICEKSHLIPTEVKASSYIDDKESKKSYPTTVIVELTGVDGKKENVTYYRFGK